MDRHRRPAVAAEVDQWLSRFADALSEGDSSADGTLLLCDGTRVWTVGRDGRLRPAAGNGD